MATPVANFIALTGDPLKDPLIQGAAWTFSGARNLRYSLNLNFDFDNAGSPIPGAGGAWTAAFSNAFARALTSWSNVANITFTLDTTQSGSYGFQSTADIAVVLSGNDLQQNLTGAVALGLFPDPAYANTVLDAAGYTRAQYPRPEGDILLDNFFAGFNYLGDGGFGFWTMIHEIGHALGLKHPVDDGANGRPTYSSLGVPQYNNENYTVMSYSDIANISATGHAATPMPLEGRCRRTGAGGDRS